MKKIYLLLLFVALCPLSHAQAPQSFKYQAVVRNAAGQILVNQLVSVKVSLLLNDAFGATVYSETHTKATNEFGLINMNIGEGTVVSGDFSNIDWGAGTYFVKTEVDINGGSIYEFMGTTQLLSVPYALFAEKSAASTSDNDTSSINEIQALSLNNDTLQLSNGGSVYLGYLLDNTDNQTLYMPDQYTLQISNGNSVTLSAGMADLDASITNELQYLNLSNDTLYLSQGNYVVIPKSLDDDPLNEIQVLSRTGSDVTLSNGGGTINIEDNDADPNNEIQTISRTGNDVIISNGGGTVNIEDNDSDSSNEIQSLSLNQDVLSLSGSNNVNLKELSLRTLEYPLGFYYPLICFDTLTVPTDSMLFMISQPYSFCELGLPVFGPSTTIINQYPLVNDLCGYLYPVGSIQSSDFSITSTLTFIVPSNKILIIKSLSVIDYNIISDNVLIFEASSSIFRPIVPPNAVLKTNSSTSVRITGYLIDAN